MIGSNLGLLGERNHMKFNLRVIQVKIEQFPFLTSEHRDRDQEQNTNKLSRSISTETNLHCSCRWQNTYGIFNGRVDFLQPLYH